MSSLQPPNPMTGKASPLVGSCQLLQVLSDNWACPHARLQRYRRDRSGDDWQPVGQPVSVSLGRSGMAWGIGLHPPQQSGGRIKQEGDGCSPAGVFRITELFGTAAPESPFACSARLPYRTATPDLKAIDDPRSRHYNRIVDQGRIDPIDWTSCEDMLRDDERYAIGAVVGHNADGQPGAGSCIFLHVWQADGAPTAGCTAAALADMSEICRWLDAAAHPLLVQLPQAEFGRLKEPWGLP